MIDPSARLTLVASSRSLQAKITLGCGGLDYKLIFGPHKMFVLLGAQSPLGAKVHFQYNLQEYELGAAVAFL